MALLLTLIVLPITSSAAEWSVWDGDATPSSTPLAQPTPNMNLRPTWALGRQFLPDLSRQEGRLRYVGEMQATADGCLRSGDQSFSSTDLNELQRLWALNAGDLTYEQIWPVYYDLMHLRAGGGTAISNAGCAWAKAWFIEDVPRLEVAGRTALTPTP